MKRQTPIAAKSRKKKATAWKDIGAIYNQYKLFEGQQYTSMKIGRSHKWYYDKGEWKDHKITPDMWEIEYGATKRRAGKAPEGSGVPVGTEYHWYILAHQHVRKLDANNYSTTMTGLKYKLAHSGSISKNGIYPMRRNAKTHQAFEANYRWIGRRLGGFKRGSSGETGGRREEDSTPVGKKGRNKKPKKIDFIAKKFC